MRPERPGPGAWLLRIALALFSLAMTAAAAEIAARLYLRVSGAPLHPPMGANSEAYRDAWLERRRRTGEFPYGYTEYDPRLGWRMKRGLRGQRVEDQPPVTTNSIGARSSREFAPRPEPGATRIAAVGDSYTFGYDGADDEVWPALLEEQLDRAETINLGVPGHGNDQALLQLEESGLPLSPTIVIHGFYEEDANRNLLSFRDYAKPRFVLDGGELRLLGVPVPPPEEVAAGPGGAPPISRAFHLLTAGRRANRAAAALESEDWAARRERILRAILRRMADRCREAGAKFLLVFIPFGSMELRRLTVIQEAAARIAREEGIEMLDLSPALDAASSLGRSPYSGHFNRLGNLAAAKAIRERLVDLGWARPAAPEVLARHAARLAEEMKAPPSGYKDRLGLADLAQAEGRWEDAAAQMRAALEERPGDPRLLNNLGYALRRAGRTGEALQAYEDAVAADPAYSAGWNNLGLTLSALDRTGEAAAALRKAAELAPRVPDYHFNLGNALRRLGRPDEAALAYKAALALDARFHPALMNLGTLLAEAGDYAGAVRKFEEALAAVPDDAAAMENLNEARRRLAAAEGTEAPAQ